jgi:hypothetical protein
MEGDQFMKISRFAAAAGLAVLAIAGSAEAGPRAVSRGLKVMAATPVEREPQMVRGVRRVNGQIVGTTPWKPYKGSQKDVPPSAYAFDAYENGLGVPTDGAPPNGNRYILLWTGGGPVNYVSPVRLSDMTMAPGFDGAQSTYVDLLFYAGDQSSPGTNVDFFLALFTTEETFDATCPAPVTVYDGIQLGFGPGDGFFFSNVDVSSDPTLFWTLPADGEGAYLIQLSQDAGGTVIAAGQTGLWCTSEDTLPVPLNNRAGTNNVAEGTDESTPPQCGAISKATNVPNGTIELLCECFDFTFNIPNVATVLTSSLAFGAEPGNACYPDCDSSGTLDIDDFICFQTFFAIGDPYADCEGDGDLDIDDFICFQTFFAIGC